MVGSQRADDILSCRDSGLFARLFMISLEQNMDIPITVSLAHKHGYCYYCNFLGQNMDIPIAVIAIRWFPRNRKKYPPKTVYTKLIRTQQTHLPA